MKIIRAVLLVVALAAVCKAQEDTAKFRYRIALPDNPDWTSFKFKLLRVEKMSRAGWDKFVEDQL
jgi:hypothetical protein